jgi:hypothetical protein
LGSYSQCSEQLDVDISLGPDAVAMFPLLVFVHAVDRTTRRPKPFSANKHGGGPSVDQGLPQTASHRGARY